MIRRRPAVIIASLALALVAAVQPAAAFTIVHDSGTTYDQPNVLDESGYPGATCVYKNNAGDTNDTLSKIVLREFNTHAPFAQYAYVGFRLAIVRDVAPFDGVYVPYDSTPMVRKLANEEKVAFFKATWTRPAGVSGRFRAIIKLNFYKPGTTSPSKGELRGRIDSYKHKLGTTGLYFVDGEVGDPGWCNTKYPAV